MPVVMQTRFAALVLAGEAQPYVDGGLVTIGIGVRLAGTEGPRTRCATQQFGRNCAELGELVLYRL